MPNLSSMLKLMYMFFFLVDLFQDKGNVCLGLLNGTEINHGSTIIVGGIDELLSSNTWILSLPIQYALLYSEIVNIVKL